MRRAHLAGFEEVQANVGVAGGGVQAELAEVLADVFRRGLRQQTVNALPETEQRPLNNSARLKSSLAREGMWGEILEMDEEYIHIS